ncbi:hypothetical protein [Myroides odoratus]|uniref:hypothetical protein n=1 Tax=Myroides odoratus TaxID=256 RepID=UPI0033425D6E
MRKKRILYLLFLLTITISNAQIGINVSEPLANLHVNGNIQITKDIRFGGDSSVAGNAGNQGQFLMSNGENIAPQWTTLNIPIVPAGSFSMTNSYVMIDKIGVNLNEGAEKRKYELDEYIDIVNINDPYAAWHILTELNHFITIQSSSNKVNFTLQTMAHLSDKVSSPTAIPEFSYAIGVFVDRKLKSVKPFNILGKKNFDVVTLIATVENLTIGDHQIEIAVIPRRKDSYYTGNLAIGRPNDESDNISPFMSYSSLKTDVFEVLN